MKPFHFLFFHFPRIPCRTSCRNPRRNSRRNLCSTSRPNPRRETPPQTSRRSPRWTPRPTSFGVELVVEITLVWRFGLSVAFDLLFSWCEALSLKFTRPYYVDFSVNS